MKKFLLTVVLLLVAMPVYAHQPWVHQYILHEAYRYLEKHIGPIRGLHDRIFNVYGNDYYGYGKSSRIWELQEGISIGIWQEDLRDPIWNNSGFMGATITATHFWDSDNGDDADTDFDSGTLVDYANAYLKARKYMYCGENLYGNHGVRIDGDYRVYHDNGLWKGHYNCEAVKLEYQTLCDLVINGTCNVPNGYYYGTPLSLKESTQNYFSPQRAKSIGFNIFGHLLHLLTDASVPAHTRGDDHACGWGGGDYFELYLGSVLNAPSEDCEVATPNSMAKRWTAQTASQQGGLLLEVFSMSDRDALRYLFYTMNQLSNHFGTRDYGGNDWLLGGNSLLVSARFAQLNSTGVPEEVWFSGQYDVFDYTADELINYAIRVTATMMYWFAAKTNLVGCPQTLYQQNHTYYGMTSPTEAAAVFKASSKIVAGKNVNSSLQNSQGDVIIESTANLQYSAGDAVHLKDGFHAKAGCNFHAKIENACPLTAQTCTYNNAIDNNNPPFAKRPETGLKIQDIPDTAAKCSVFVLKNATVSYSADTVFLSNWTRTKEIPRTIDSTGGDSMLVETPIIIYADSVIVINEGDSILYAADDSVLVVENKFCTVILTDSNAIIIRSEWEDTGANNGKNPAPLIQNIYPNPNSEYFDVQIDGRGLAAVVTIYTQMGIKVSESTLTPTEMKSKLYTGDLPPGIYTAVVQTANGRTSKSFVVHR